MNDEERQDVLMELETRILLEEDPEMVAQLSKAYKEIKEAKDEDWKKTLELDIENKKSKRTFLATIISGIGGLGLAAVIKGLFALKFQSNAIDAENEGLYTNRRNMTPPNL